MDKDPFKEYIRQSEPSKRDKGYAWHTAIGLQAVDGLKPSKYLIDTAIKNIEGDISIDEAQELLNTYYEENPKADTDDRTEEADKVAVRIAKILSEKAFSFTPNEYISIHKKLFAGIYGHAGKLRDYNITKKEWVLNGATVLYGSASELRATLDYDFAEEKKFSYKNLSMEEIIHHLAFFVSRLWQIHVFGEGNTRTTAVFFIKYLRTLGFDATNDIFAENAWYFRNALVRANYNDLKNGVHETTEYLELFLRNLLLDEKNELHNRTMHISGRFAEVDIERVKVDIESGEVDIESTKVDIRNKLLSFSDTISEKTLEALKRLQEKGVKLCLATGRGPMLVPHFEGVEFDAFLTYNGSYCYDHSGTLYSNCIPLKDIERIIKNADKMGKPVALATKDRMAANGKDQDLIDYYAFGNAEVDVAEDFEDIKKEKVYQVLMGARVEEYQEILKGVQGAEITAWWDRAVDIIPVNAGKGAGIEKMLKHYGIDKSQAMAFGDGNNDIEMLKAVGNGIAMANASDDLKAVADEICGDVSEDGIYHYCLEKRLI